jgi:hypothetical protein
LKFLLTAVLLTGLSIDVYAEKKKGLIGDAVESSDQGYYGMAGCGLGSVLFGESENKGGQILASTTNGVYSNNTFGVSSGTSNCVPSKGAKTAEVQRNVEIFVAANRDALANDIVKSRGETIVTVAGIMGCKDTNYLGDKLQTRYETIFKNSANTELARNVVDTVKSDRYLFETCSL